MIFSNMRLSYLTDHRSNSQLHVYTDFLQLEIKNPSTYEEEAKEE